jgi:hypothetical protein
MLSLDSKMLDFLGLMVAISLLPMAVVLFFMIRKGLKEKLRLQSAQTLVCPETGKPVTVKVDAAHAGYTAAYDSEDLRLKDCSRWPEKAGCAQDCISEAKR